MNIRALRHIIGMRCDPSAEEEICYVIGLIASTMIKEECNLFGDFEIKDGFYKPKYWKV